MHVTAATRRPDAPDRRPRRRIHAAAFVIMLVFATALASAAVASPREESTRATTAQIETAGAATSADLSVTLMDSPDPVATGQVVTYHVDVHNAGPQTATGVSLADDLPSGATFGEARPSSAGCSPPDGVGVVNCSLADLPPGDDATVAVDVYPTKSGSLSDGASASAAQADPTPADATASESTAATGADCTIIGTPRNDRSLDGTKGDDVICGLGGNDTISGLDGSDRLDGGPGNDSLFGNDGSDQLLGRAGADHLGGGQGFDLVRFDGATAPVNVDLSAGRARHEGRDSLVGIEGIVGSPHDDMLKGDAGGNEIYGRGGADSIVGGRGFDYARYDFAPAAVTVDLAAGTATGGEGSDSLAGIEGIVGSGSDDTLIGDRNGNQIEGGVGGDIIRGAGGNDASLYTFAPTAVQVDLAAGTATGGAGTDTLVGIEGILGSSFADQLAGDGGPNRISGDSGPDDIAGRNGGDTLFGDPGDDSLHGGAGGDYLDGGPGHDVLDGGSDVDRCIAGRGDRTHSCEAHRAPTARTPAQPPARSPARQSR
jgi:uncharacterized repeat protein (TIGR01451 family)